ncbi:MAG TPA: hypothetical protein VMT85_00575 [Thermoanaerobaculia bacterium]|nr:hypothetical protein [Thermoanaerobaculia bacterium]
MTDRHPVPRPSAARPPRTVPTRGGWAATAASVATILLLVAAASAGETPRVRVAEEAGGGALRFDVAMSGPTFFFEGATNENGFPANGTPFIVRGWIYPAGTFAAHGSSSGTNADGSPEFPDQVLGTWYCRGWHLQDGDALTGPVVATTQVFDLDPERPGAKTLVTDGLELADFLVPFDRAIVGGTGRYRTAGGSATQVYVDFNGSGGFNTSFVLRPNGR